MKIINKEPYWKREAGFIDGKNKNDRSKLVYRTPNFKEIMTYFGWQLLRIIFTPFYLLFITFPRWVKNLFYDRIRTGDNGIIGPGFHTYYTSKFSWGKLTFVLFILFIIIYLLFLR